ncbi:hypothetical protein ACFWVC_11285 [Streptomyces sp. NPDC058691]|uniref:hypothetical protein n=1 Tax=Streptomyces sp. NPDC058691 TaxID=3346601 RepID=UPI00365E5D6C
MLLSRTVRIASTVALAALSGLASAGAFHAQADTVVARDTTWVAAPNGDTTWAVTPVGDDTTWRVVPRTGAKVFVANDTTW